eukprot:4498416-Pyramimonas_sp.AAC.1
MGQNADLVTSPEQFASTELELPWRSQWVAIPWGTSVVGVAGFHANLIARMVWRGKEGTCVPYYN